MEYGRDYYAGEKLDDHCEKYALVIWENGGDVENQCCCVNIKKIWIPEMLTNSKQYGPIDVYVVGWKGYKLIISKKNKMGEFWRQEVCIANVKKKVNMLV